MTQANAKTQSKTLRRLIAAAVFAAMTCALTAAFPIPMFNGYFSSPAYRDETLEEKIKIHEAGIPKLFEFMLYGVAEGGKR